MDSDAEEQRAEQKLKQEARDNAHDALTNKNKTYRKLTVRLEFVEAQIEQLEKEAESLRTQIVAMVNDYMYAKNK